MCLYEEKFPTWSLPLLLRLSSSGKLTVLATTLVKTRNFAFAENSSIIIYFIPIEIECGTHRHTVSVFGIF